MNINSLRIIYMGTPEFAVAPLQKILEEGCNVVAVITAPDKPSGRGKKIKYSAVKQFTLDIDSTIPILQPTNLKDQDFVNDLNKLQPDLQVVVAFRMLPEVVWRIPVLGTFNLHASLLPQYRGAAPINHAIINGESVTGVTTFMIDEKIDTGNILLQEKSTIGELDNAGELHDRLMNLGANLVYETIHRLEAGNLNAQSQEDLKSNHDNLKTAPKIFKEHCRIPWGHQGIKVHNLIRGLSPSPGAFTFLERSESKLVLCKIFSSTFEPSVHCQPPGSIQSDGKRNLKVAVLDGYIHIGSIQQEGKRRMDVGDFLAGINLSSEPYRFS